ncbi:hypothetical protein [Aquabacterium sp.]|uniref:hypothetical protein n=1 Tax=Aquabacterium sp. TaxID=1872578 RepID=UPI0040380F07
MIFFYVILLAVSLWLIWRGIVEDAPVAVLAFAVIATAGAFGLYHETRPEVLAQHQAEDLAEAKAQAAKELRETTPHVIRQADGCKVYTWKGGDGRYHYFTRCPSTTSTESSWETCTTSGKTRTCKTNVETVPTENSK